MSDNSSRLDGASALETVASDDIGGVKYQRVKLNVGADNATADVQPPDADAKAASAMLPAAGMVYNNAGTWDRVYGANALGDGSSGLGHPVMTQRLYNESTFDRQRGNTNGTLLASAARTATTSSATQTNYNARGVLVFLNITVASGTGGLALLIQSQDPISGNGITYSAPPTSIIATGCYGYVLYPGATAGVAGSPRIQSSLSGVLSRSWTATVSHGDASSYTYSVGYSLIV